MSETLIVCSHCGGVIDLADPRLQALTPETVLAWHQLQDVFKRGQRLSAQDIADVILRSRTQAYWYIAQLTNAGLMEAEPKRVDGIYQVYMLT